MGEAEGAGNFAESGDVEVNRMEVESSAAEKIFIGLEVKGSKLAQLNGESLTFRSLFSPYFRYIHQYHQVHHLVIQLKYETSNDDFPR